MSKRERNAQLAILAFITVLPAMRIVGIIAWPWPVLMISAEVIIGIFALFLGTIMRPMILPFLEAFQKRKRIIDLDKYPDATFDEKMAMVNAEFADMAAQDRRWDAAKRECDRRHRLVFGKPLRWDGF